MANPRRRTSLACVLLLAISGCSSTAGGAEEAEPVAVVITEEAARAAPDEGTESDTADPGAADAAALDGTQTDGAQMKITGTATGASDVATDGGGPLSGDVVAFIPVAEEAQVWTAIDFEPSDEQLATLGGLLARDAIPTATLASIENGTFGADPEDGDYLVCLLADADPGGLKGCGRMTVTGPENWGLSSDEGGVFVWVQQ